MEAVTLPADENHTSQVIEYRENYGSLSHMVTASRYTSDSDPSNNAMTITIISDSVRSFHLSSVAMTALVKLWGAGQESDTVARLQQQNEGYRAVITSDDKLIDRANEEIDRLRAQIAAMQSQGSFRMALLESVVSAARDVLGQERDSEDWLGLEDALQGLDEWQPDDASTAVSVPDTRHAPGWQCPGCGGVNKHHPECPELALVLGIAPVAPGVCPECNYGDGTHSSQCSQQDWEDESPLMAEPHNFQR